MSIEQDYENIKRNIDSQPDGSAYKYYVPRKWCNTLSSDGAWLCKVIATFCVVFFHSYKIFGFLKINDPDLILLRGFHSFGACGVPVFFLLSGYFLFYIDWEWKRNIKEKIKTLLIPYCLFILLYTSISIIGSIIFPEFFDNVFEFNLKEWVMHIIGIPFNSSPIFYGPLWFLRDLFILNVFSFVLVSVLKKIPGFILIPLMIFVYFLPISKFIRYPLVFFVIGMCFGIKKKLVVVNNIYLITLLSAAGFIIPVLNKGNFVWDLSVLLMTASVVFISEFLMKYNKVNVISHCLIPFSFPIYLLHEYPMATLQRLLALKHISFETSVIVFFVAPFIIIILCIIFIKIWKKLLPSTYALFTAGR